MKKIYSKERLKTALLKCSYRELLLTLPVELFLIEYDAGEMISTPDDKSGMFQFVVSGGISIYFIRDDGTRYSLDSGTGEYIIGDLELFRITNENIYSEVTRKVVAIAFLVKDNGEQLFENAPFMRLIGENLARKLYMVTRLDAIPSNLNERVLSYMEYKCVNHQFKGIEKTAFTLHCSARQLQRVMNELEQDGKVRKIGKGCYRLQ